MKPNLKEVKDEPAMTPDEMKALLLADKREREKRAAERIQKVLDEERCVMNPVMTVAPGSVSGRIEITAKD